MSILLFGGHNVWDIYNVEMKVVNYFFLMKAPMKLLGKATLFIV
jgi:hypothetical protein